MVFDLTGCYDLHIHTAPDVIARKLTDLEMTKQAHAAKMGGFMIKSHKFPTCGRAAAMHELYPDVDVLSGIALNYSVGGLNPDAVLAAAKMGAKLVWLATVDSKEYRKLKKCANWESGVSILDENGNIRPELYEIAEIVKTYDLTFCSGHIGSEESLRFAEFCREQGIRKFVITHASFTICQADVEELKKERELGAYIEYSYTHVLSGVCDWDYLVGQLRELGSDHVYLSTDLGQTENCYPAEGFAEFCDRLLAAGISGEDIYKMVRENPKSLIS